MYCCGCKYPHSRNKHLFTTHDRCYYHTSINNKTVILKVQYSILFKVACWSVFFHITSYQLGECRDKSLHNHELFPASLANLNELWATKRNRYLKIVIITENTQRQNMSTLITYNILSYNHVYHWLTICECCKSFCHSDSVYSYASNNAFWVYSDIK